MASDNPPLTLQQVDDLAHLARLALTPEERRVYPRQLADILAYVDTLQAIDTAHIEASFRVLPQSGPWRRDEARPSIPVNDALANAPQRQDDYFRIPRILEE